MPEPFLINGSGGGVDKLGVITAEQVWEVESEAACLSLDKAHPLNIPVSFRQWRNQSHGKWHVTLTFEGVDNVSKAAGKEEYEIEGTTGEDPIESHWDIARLLELYPYDTARAESDGRIVWKLKMPDPNSGVEVRNPLAGYEAFLNPGLTWTQNKLYSELPADLLDGLGCIETPQGNPPQRPSPPNGLAYRNWLKTRSIGRKRGNIWQVTRSWTLSGPGGWNAEVYAWNS
jgi:hypothetical protein